LAAFVHPTGEFAAWLVVFFDFGFQGFQFFLAEHGEGRAGLFRCRGGLGGLFEDGGAGGDVDEEEAAFGFGLDAALFNTIEDVLNGDTPEFGGDGRNDPTRHIAALTSGLASSTLDFLSLETIGGMLGV